MIKIFKRLCISVAAVMVVCAGWSGAANADVQYGKKMNLAPGIMYYPFTYENWSGKLVNGHVTEISPGTELLEIRPALGVDKLGKKETLSSMAARHGAVAAVNGGFFDGASGNPIGGLVVDGSVQYHADVLRTSVGWTGKGDFTFGYFAPQAAVKVGGQSFTVDFYNRLPEAGSVALYTPLYKGDQNFGGLSRVVLEKTGLQDYQVVEDIAGSENYILVFSNEQSGLAGVFGQGDTVGIDFNYGSNLGAVDHLVTGGPLLVQDGIPVFQAVNEGFRGSVLTHRARTAVGVKDNGNILLVVMEKQKATADDEDATEQAQDSAGLTTDDLAWLMARLGALQAAGLDGGGSSEMWVNGKMISRPSGGSERQLANALVVLYQIPTYFDGHRVYFDVPPYFEEGHLYVSLRGVLELLGAEVSWDEETGIISAVRGDRSVSLTVGKKEALMGQEPVVLDAVPKIVDEHVVVPVRFITESLGAQIDWQDSPKALIIHNPDGEEF